MTRSSVSVVYQKHSHTPLECSHVVHTGLEMCCVGSFSAHRVLDSVWVKEEAGKHPCDHVNTTHRSLREWRLRNSAFLWPAYISCCLALPVTGQALLLPSARPWPWPCPGYSGLTALSHISHAFNATLMEEPRHIFFPWKKIYFLSHAGTSVCLTYSHREGQSWIVFSFSYTFLPTCSLFSPFSLPLFVVVVHCNVGLQVQIHRNWTVLPRIHFCPSNAHWTSLSPAPRPSQTHSSLLFFWTPLLLGFISAAQWATAGIFKSVWSVISKGHLFDFLNHSAGLSQFKKVSKLRICYPAYMEACLEFQWEYYVSLNLIM